VYKLVLKVSLANTGLKVSRLCFGTEPFTFKKGPEGAKTQGDVEAKEGGRRLRQAFNLGVNFWDTSDDYGTHPHVAEGLKLVPRKEIAVADKTNALTYKQGWEALELAQNDLGTNYIDMMFLHIVPPVGSNRKDSQGNPYYSGTLEERKGALKAFIEAKESGIIKATALSTHSTKVLRQVESEPDIDVVCTTLNKIHGFIDDGSLQEHIDAIKRVKESGKFVYVIKVLNAGRLRDNAKEAIRYAFQFHDFIDAWNIGMYDANEVRKNLSLMEQFIK
jgi:aryl-alcohol dehydrogenase-like predicted oxidoreductase